VLDAFLRDGPTRHSELCDKAITERCQMFLPRRFVVRCRVPVPQLLASVDSPLCPLVPPVLSSCTCAAAPGWHVSPGAASPKMLLSCSEACPKRLCASCSSARALPSPAPQTRAPHAHHDHPFTVESCHALAHAHPRTHHNHIDSAIPSKGRRRAAQEEAHQRPEETRGECMTDDTVVRCRFGSSTQIAPWAYPKGTLL
jgi:hypothetical protein